MHRRIRTRLSGVLTAVALISAVAAGPAAGPAAAQQRAAAVPAAPPLLLRGGQLIDGTGAPARRADVRVAGDSIAEIGPELRPRPGEQVVDVSGLVVAPGFIDLHSHADRGIERQPLAPSQLQQGITTVIVGQDGGGSLPVADFLESIDRLHPAVNYATLVGHGTVRGLVLGGDFKRAATPAEVETMKALVERAMRDGALGLSSGLEYDPGFYAAPDEVAALAAVVKRYGGYYASHVRDEENEVFAAWTELLDVGRRTGIPVEVSHIKLASKPVWGRAAEALKLMADARKDGVEVVADWYPYTFWSSSMYVLIPDRDFENRAEWEKGLDEIGGAQNVLVTGYAPDSSYNGKTVAELAAAKGTDAVSLIIQMIREAGPDIGIIGTAMQEQDLDTFFRDPNVLFGSDGSPVGRHPRGYNAAPRVLGRYVRQRKVAPLAEAVARMTGRAAAWSGLSDRGILAVGRKADIVAFDPNVIEDRGTSADPSQPPIGVRYTIVNGEIALQNGAPTGARPGRGLRRAPSGPRDSTP